MEIRVKQLTDKIGTSGPNMGAVLPFRDVLDALEHLSSDEQDALIAIVQKRKAEAARCKLVE